MKIIVNQVLTAVEPNVEILFYCKNKLEMPNPDYAKKVRMGLWVGNTPKMVCLYSQKDGNLVLPFGCLKDARFFGEAEYYSAFKEHERVNYGPEDVPLYGYQERAVNEMLASKFGILQSPAGSGKTQMGIALIKEFGEKALWLTHTRDLLNQSRERASKYIPKHLIGTITEGRVDIGRGVTFATIQTMSKLDLVALRDEWDVIIVDECHRVAGSPTAVTQFSKVLNNLSARHKIGLSATVHRSDGLIKATFALLGDVAYKVPKEAVEDKIMKVGIMPVETGTQLTRQCLNPDGTLNYAKMINYLAEDEARNEVINEYLLKHQRFSCLILSDRLEHLETLMNNLPDGLMEKAVMVSGKMTSKKAKAEREQAIEDMRTGKKRFLFATYALAKEGLDIPRLERLFMVTPQKDYAVITQSIGRIARTYDGKVDPVAIDFIDNIPFLEKAYKKRCTTYRKNGCYFVEDSNEDHYI